MGASKPASFPERHSIIASPLQIRSPTKAFAAAIDHLVPGGHWPLRRGGRACYGSCWDQVLPSTCYSTCATHPPHATPSYPLDAAGVEKITLLRFFAPQRKLAVGPREGEGDCRGVQGCTRVYKGDCRGVKSGNRVPYPRVALMYHHPMGGRGGY